MQSTRFYLGFNLVNGVGPSRLERLIAVCGSLEAAWHASTRDMAAAGLDARTARALQDTRRRIDLEAELERVARAGVGLLTIEDAAYPQALAHIPGAPPLLYTRGELAAADALAVAVVGTRSPTSYGREMTQRIAAELAAAGVTIVSGLAIGIDHVAHTAALDAGGRTIAVLACGVDLVYPERHMRLAERICQHGALVSEFPLGTRPMPQLFPVRNRLISGLSRGVLVTEARPGSGALITVDFALEQGRDVFGLPGPAYSQTSAGPHRLIQNGAGLVTCGADILEALSLSPPPAPELHAITTDDPAERAILAHLGGAPMHIDELARRCGLHIAQISATLTLLELRGMVRQAAAMEYVRLCEAPQRYAAVPSP
jgi:DNA processing protein